MMDKHIEALARKLCEIEDRIVNPKSAEHIYTDIIERDWKLYVPHAKAMRKLVIDQIIEMDWPVKQAGETAEHDADKWKYRLEGKLILQQLKEPEDE